MDIDRRLVKDLLPLLQSDPCSGAVDVEGLSVRRDFLEMKLHTVLAQKRTGKKKNIVHLF